jgi:hypothetical protein
MENHLRQGLAKDEDEGSQHEQLDAEVLGIPQVDTLLDFFGLFRG